jgi:hypothetical protein
MAPRANWKGFLRLSLVTCPVALFPATSDSEKISFNQINRKTGHRIKYLKVDAETGDEVDADDIMKGYKVDADTYIEMTNWIISRWRARAPSRLMSLCRAPRSISAASSGPIIWCLTAKWDTTPMR